MASNFDLGNFELKEEISLSDLMLMPTQNLIDVKKDDTTCSTKRRFSTPMSNVELNKKIQNAIPRKTRSNNKWAVGVWVDWTLERNLCPETYADGGRAIPSDPNMLTNELLKYWMAHFIQECRRGDSTPYPPNTLVQITSGIQR